ncbi:MAG: rhomboid family intramembrane serine protease [Proteobacteria bacterium]|nr:rhomboid family intramembrane serine protease [Pseudomonadota bacterium]
MFLPIGDTPNPRNYIAWVNWLLIALNVGVYVFLTLPLSSSIVDTGDPLLIEYLKLLAEKHQGSVDLQRLVASISAYELFVYAHGYKPAAPELGDLFFSMFLHGGLAHLGGNMLFLWIFGDNVEHRLGRIGYLFVYLATGVIATLTFAFFAADSLTPLVGASGAISGVLGLYFLLFPRNRVKVFIVLFPIYFDVLLIPVRWVLGFYVIADNLLPFIIGAESGVAYGAHLGGFAGGFAVALAGQKYDWRWPWTLSREKRKRKRDFVPAAPQTENPLDALTRAVESGDRTKAMVSLESLDRLEMARLGPEQCVVLADWLENQGMTATAHKLLRRCLAANQSSEELARVYLNLGLLSLSRGQPTAAYQHLQSVFDYNPDPKTESSAREALETINVYRRRQ